MSDRWVCKRCFADNEEADHACQRCGLIPTSAYFGSMISPSEGSWGSGDRSFICVLYDPDDPELTESLAGVGR